MLASPRVADLVATVCMLRSFLIIGTSPSEERLGEIENIARLCHAILTECGSPPHLASLYSLWEACVRTLRAFEQELFPNDPIETPAHIILPNAPQPLCRVTNPSWIPHRVHVRPAWLALRNLRQFLAARYDMELHIQTFKILDDSELLLQTVAHLVGTALD